MVGITGPLAPSCLQREIVFSLMYATFVCRPSMDVRPVPRDRLRKNDALWLLLLRCDFGDRGLALLAY